MEDDDLKIALEIAKRNLEALETAEEGDEYLHALQNYLSSVNSLVAQSYRLARENEEGGAWVAKLQREELDNLLAER